jgi:hypothetical protein
MTTLFADNFQNITKQAGGEMCASQSGGGLDCSDTWDDIEFLEGADGYSWRKLDRV